MVSLCAVCRSLGWDEEKLLAAWLHPLWGPHWWDLAKVRGTLRQDHAHKPACPCASQGRMLCLFSLSYKALGKSL